MVILYHFENCSVFRNSMEYYPNDIYIGSFNFPSLILKRENHSLFVFFFLIILVIHHLKVFELYQYIPAIEIPSAPLRLLPATREQIQ